MVFRRAGQPRFNREEQAMQYRKRIFVLSCITLLGSFVLSRNEARADEGCRAWLSLCDNGLQCCSQICESQFDGTFRCAKTGGVE